MALEGTIAHVTPQPNKTKNRIRINWTDPDHPGFYRVTRSHVPKSITPEDWLAAEHARMLESLKREDIENQVKKVAESDDDATIANPKYGDQVDTMRAVAERILMSDDIDELPKLCRMVRELRQKFKGQPKQQRDAMGLSVVQFNALNDKVDAVITPPAESMSLAELMRSPELKPRRLDGQGLREVA